MADVYNAGEAKIDGWVRQISAKIEVAKKGLAEQVKQLITMLQENLLKAARKVHSALLHLLPMSLSVDLGDAALRELTVQLAGGADVSIGIAWALRLSAGTKVSVAAKYALPETGATKASA
jgi:hypothetical protein